MSGRSCFECGDSGRLHDHHVIPQSRGGTETVPLCGECHAKAHGHPNNEGWDISNLTSEALKQKSKQGEYTGGEVPFGKQLADDGVHLEDNPAEQRAIELIGELRNDGLTLAATADELNRRGIPRRNGNEWHHVAVSRYEPNDMGGAS